MQNIVFRCDYFVSILERSDSISDLPLYTQLCLLGCVVSKN